MNLGYELGVLKRLRRTGWWHAGVRDPESVAEHSMRAAQLAALIAAEEGADPVRAAGLARQVTTIARGASGAPSTEPREPVG
jgi:5'-deoxynucleotidase YfbR-like HD superfamily hydrolase